MGDGGPLTAAQGRRLREPVAAVLLGAVWLLLLYAPLLSPQRVLATRDATIFHLPLRADLVRLAADGEPFWNPWINGGQPLLSNPNYAAFYPPTWLAAVVGPAYSLGLGVVLHAALAFAGAWLLVRCLGAGREAAALAAVGFSGGGALLSLTHVYTAFAGLAWCPWALVAALRAFRARRGRWWAPAVGAALALALSLLAGEPVVALVVALCVAALAAAVARRRGRAVLPRLAAVAVGSGLFSAVQLLPTAFHVAESARGAGLRGADAHVWSMHPARLAELFFPLVWGDPTGRATGRYFGAPFQDQGLGFLYTPYPGLLLTVVGIAALARGVRYRLAWTLLAAAGTVLALGRHLPLFPWLHQHLPGLTAIRFPERFFLLTLVALTVAGALGWHRLLRRRSDGSRLPLVLAAAAALAAVLASLAVRLMPRVVERWIAGTQPGELSPAGMTAALAFVRAETLRATLLAVAVTAVLWLLRRPWVRTSLLAVAAVLLLAVDLWIYGAGLLRTAPVELIAEAPVAAGSLVPGARVFSDDLVAPPRKLVRLGAGEDPELAELRGMLARLEPYSGNLWGVAYALNGDFDQMLTRWARHPLPLLEDAWTEPEHALALIGAWNGGTLIVQRSAEAQRADLAAGRPAPPFLLLANPRLLPRVRSVEEVRVHRSLATAVTAVRTQGFDVSRRDHWVGGEAADGRLAPGLRSGAPVQVERVAETGSRIGVRVSAEGPAWLVVAATYHHRWRGRFAGRPVPLVPTALGQIGVALPAGAGELELLYRDPWVGVGAAVSLGSVVAALALLVVLRRRRRPPAT